MDDTPRRVRTLVVGAGFAGLGTAIKLEENGFSDFLVVDRGSDVGGTWRDNTYPGAACDVPSQLYSFSFAPNPDWSRSFSPQPEIQAYLERTAEQSGVLDRFRFGVTVEDIVWDETDNVWQVGTDHGTVTADVLVSAAGALSDPKLPDIDGIDSFEGEIFHSARWNHDYDLAGKRVAVIGTGASSIQIVPEIAEQVSHLDVYQRTAPWVMPRNDRATSDREVRLPLGAVLPEGLPHRHLLGPRVLRAGLHVNPKLAAPAKKAALANIQWGVSDPGAAREGDARLPDRLQAHPDLQRLLPGPRRRQRRPGHRRDRGDHAHRHRHRRTAPGARWTPSSWRPVSTRPSSPSRSTSPAATDRRSPTPGARGA